MPSSCWASKAPLLWHTGPCGWTCRFVSFVGSTWAHLVEVQRHRLVGIDRPGSLRTSRPACGSQRSRRAPVQRDLAEPVLASSGQSQNARLECHRIRARRSRNHLERSDRQPGPKPDLEWPLYVDSGRLFRAITSHSPTAGQRVKSTLSTHCLCWLKICPYERSDGVGIRRGARHGEPIGLYLSSFFIARLRRAWTAARFSAAVSSRGSTRSAAW
jgi:hypothetical protein